MAALPQITIDISDAAKNGIKSGPGKASGAPSSPLFRGDGGAARYIFVEPTGDNAKPHRNADLSGYIVEGCISEVDEAPTGGTFGLSYNGNSTGLTGLAYNISAVTLQAAFDANPAVGAGGVVVTKHGNFHYRIAFTTVGAKSLIVSDPALLTPSSQVYVMRGTEGGASVKEVQWLRVVQSPLAYTNAFTPEAAGTVTVTTVQAGTALLREVQRLTIGEWAYDGSFIVNASTAQQFSIVTVADVSDSLQSTGFIVEDSNGSVGVWINIGGLGVMPADIAATDRQIEITTIATNDGANLNAANIGADLDADSEFEASVVGNVIYVTQSFGGERTAPTDGDNATGFTFATVVEGLTISGSVPFDANANEMSRRLGSGFTVIKNGYSWDITYPVVGNQPAITVDASGVAFYTTYLAELNLNNDATLQRFADSGETSIDAKLEYSITPPSGDPVTIYQQDHTVHADGIGTGSSAGGPIFGGNVTKNLTWVSTVGNDSNGIVNRIDRPFLTPGAAADAVEAAGVDANIRLLPGTYDAKDLLRSVHITWEAWGARIEYTGSANGAIFDDGATGLGAESAATIIGGQWVRNGSGSASYAVRLDNGSTLYIKDGAYIISEVNHTVNITNGAVRAEGGKIVNQSASHNPINLDNPGLTPAAVLLHSYIEAHSSRDSIESNAAIAVVAAGSWTNKSPDANVSVTPGGLTVEPTFTLS